jgi:hypothetical protein
MGIPDNLSPGAQPRLAASAASNRRTAVNIRSMSAAVVAQLGSDEAEGSLEVRTVA